MNAAKTATDFAKLLGANAFASGLACVPCLDKSLMGAIAGRKVGDKRTAADMKAWILGWTAASLADNG